MENEIFGILKPRSNSTRGILCGSSTTAASFLTEFWVNLSASRAALLLLTTIAPWHGSMTGTSLSKADIGLGDPTNCQGQDMSSMKQGKRIGNPTTARKLIQNKLNMQENILEINHQKQRILMEINIEKDKRLEELEKEINDQNTQHSEGIYWLRMQLETSRLEKKAADERIAELQKELRRLGSVQLTRGVGLNSTGDGDEKDNLIAELHGRLQKFESSFGVMENQMAMMKSSSAEIVQSLKEEIANLMEDRTKSEINLLNQLSELDSENRQRHLEFIVELHNKDEIIETLRNLEAFSTSANGTMTYDGSASAEESKSSMSNDHSTHLIQASKDQSSLILRLGEENAELQQKLEEASRALKDLKLGPKPSDDSQSVKLASEERRHVELSIDRLKTAMASTTTAVSKLKGMVGNIRTDDDSGTNKEKKNMLSILESASLVHEEVNLSILLTELKLRNEFECLKKNKLAINGGDQTIRDRQQLVNDLKKIENDALVELGKARAEFSRQMKDVEKRIKSEKSKSSNMSRKDTQKRANYHEPKSSQDISSIGVLNELNYLNKLISDSKADRDSADGSESTGDRLMISRRVLNLLEKELIQSAERIKGKNKKIGSLKEELERSKAREIRLRNELRDTTKHYASSKSYKVVNDVREASDEDRRDSMFSKSIPREIHTKVEDQSIMSPVLSPGQRDRRKISIKLKGEGRRRRKGMSDDSQEGGTNPAKAPVHSLAPGDRVKTIGFVPSSSNLEKSNDSNTTSTTRPLSDASRRAHPTSHEIKKLVFLPPCFFKDLDQFS